MNIPFPISDFTGPAALTFVALLVITRRLVWHTDLRRERERGDKWEGIALRALGVAEKMTDVHVEVANEVLTAAAAHSDGDPP